MGQFQVFIMFRNVFSVYVLLSTTGHTLGDGMLYGSIVEKSENWMHANETFFRAVRHKNEKQNEKKKVKWVYYA